MKALFLVCFIILSPSFGFSQKYILENYNPREKEVIKTTQITYYGVDFSKIRLTDAKLVGKDLLLKKYFSAWLSLFEEKFRPAYYVKKLLKKEKLSYSPADVQNRINLVPEKWVILDDYSFNIDTVKSVVASYHLQEKDGIGFVIIPKTLMTEITILQNIVCFLTLHQKKFFGPPRSLDIQVVWV